MIDFISKYFYYIFLALILLTVIQRKHRETGDRKRMATLIIGILVFIMYIGALGIKSKNLDQIWILLPLMLDLSLLYVLREKILIFKKSCQKCGKSLSGSDILYIDSNICSECSGSVNSYDKSDEDISKAETDDSNENNNSPE